LFKIFICVAPTVPFNSQKIFLPVESSGKTSHVAIFADDPVAWNDDAQRIFARGRSCGANGFWRICPARQFAVADGLTERNQRNLPPDFTLEARPFK